MALIAQIGFEIVGPAGSTAEVFQEMRNRRWRTVVEEEFDLDEVARESAEALLRDAQTCMREQHPVLRYFTPYWRVHGPLADPLDAISVLYDEGFGFSGTWRYVIAEIEQQDYQYWGEDQDVRLALSSDFVLKPAWTRFGVHCNGEDLRWRLSQGRNPVSISDADIERLSVALGPKLDQLVLETAAELGLLPILSAAEASG